MADSKILVMSFDYVLLFFFTKKNYYEFRNFFFHAILNFKRSDLARFRSEFQSLNPNLKSLNLWILVFVSDENLIWTLNIFNKFISELRFTYVTDVRLCLINSGLALCFSKKKIRIFKNISKECISIFKEVLLWYAKETLCVTLLNVCAFSQNWFLFIPRIPTYYLKYVKNFIEYGSQL